MNHGDTIGACTNPGNPGNGEEGGNGNGNNNSTGNGNGGNNGNSGGNGNGNGNGGNGGNGNQLLANTGNQNPPAGGGITGAAIGTNGRAGILSAILFIAILGIAGATIYLARRRSQMYGY